MKRVTITIGEDAEVEVKVEGVNGVTCKDVTKALEKALGSVKSTKTTGEYHQREQARLRH